MQLLNEQGAADYIGLSAAFLRQSRSAGKRTISTEGPPWIKLGRSVRYDVADLDTWLMHRRVDPSANAAEEGAHDE